MSAVIVGEYTAHSIDLAFRYKVLAVPQFAQASPVGGWEQGACWWLVTSHGEAANDEVGSSAEYFAREAVRLRANVFKLRLSQVIHDDELEGWSH